MNCYVIELNFFHNEIISHCLENGTILQTSGQQMQLDAATLTHYFPSKSQNLVFERLNCEPF
jgi:hypothetical protein